MEEQRTTAASTPERPPTRAGPAATLRGLIGHLLERYRRARDAGGLHGLDQLALDGRIGELILAEAAVRHAQPAAEPGPPHVAVIGPTQTGKSTLVNLLLGGSPAEVSPLAGFTVHPQGFWVTATLDDEVWADGLFPEWQRRATNELTRDQLAAYSLTPISPPTTPMDNLFERPAELPPCVVWDTPDFDSLAARQYARGVLETAALADLHVLVLSKEKYSDLSVWRLLELLAPLRRPLIICINKLTPEAEETVSGALRARLAEHDGSWDDVPIIALPYDQQLAEAGSAAPAALVRELRQAVVDKLASASRRDRRPRAAALLRAHWDTWLAPVHEEHAAKAEWERIVHSAAGKFMAAYERDYLNHPQRFDGFRRAAIELLNLLEIPAVGGFMARARRIVTWPARQALSAGQSWLKTRRAPAHPLHSLGAEVAVLVDTLATLLTGLQRESVRRCSPSAPGCAVWQVLADRLASDQQRLNGVFEGAIKAHHEQTNAEIRATADRLYTELRKHPARLNTLRTARATIDVGYLLLAVKTGGLTPLDAVWAPATFAATSLLMEGIAGFELKREADRLKARQRAAVEEQFISGRLIPELNAVAEKLDADGLFAISEEGLLIANDALAAWENDHE